MSAGFIFFIAIVILSVLATMKASKRKDSDFVDELDENGEIKTHVVESLFHGVENELLN